MPAIPFLTDGRPVMANVSVLVGNKAYRLIEAGYDFKVQGDDLVCGKTFATETIVQIENGFATGAYPELIETAHSRAKGLRYKILLIEAQPDVAEMTEELLREHGFEVLRAASPRQARLLFAENRVDGIVSAYCFAGTDPEVHLGWLRSTDREVIIYTGWAMTSQNMKALGAFPLVAKGLSPGDLVAATNTHFWGRSS